MTASQRGVMAGMATAAVVTLACVALVLLTLPNAALALDERLVTLAAGIAVVAAWVAAGVAHVARLRFFSETAIDGAGDGAGSDPAVVRADAILRNTVEQAVLALAVYAALAILMPDPRTMLAMLVALFSIGRGLFWTGYAGGARERALGFALTFYPSVAGLLVVFARVVGL